MTFYEAVHCVICNTSLLCWRRRNIFEHETGQCRPDNSHDHKHLLHYCNQCNSNNNYNNTINMEKKKFLRHQTKHHTHRLYYHSCQHHRITQMCNSCYSCPFQMKVICMMKIIITIKLKSTLLLFLHYCHSDQIQIYLLYLRQTQCLCKTHRITLTKMMKIIILMITIM